MSIVWQCRVGSPTDKSVLLKLADCASDDGSRCYPSISRIAEETELSQRTVSRSIKNLSKIGVVEVVKIGSGTRASEYRINSVALTQCHPRHPVTPDTVSTSPDTVSPPPLTQCPRSPDTVSPSSIIEPPYQPSLNHHTPPSPPAPIYERKIHETNLGLPTPYPSQQPGQPDATPSPDTIVMFEELFAVWPAKKKKPQSRQAYTIARNRGISHEVMMAGARRFTKYHREEKTKDQYLQSLDDWISSDGWTATNGKQKNLKPQVSEWKISQT